MEVTALQGQSIIDIATQEYGSWEAAPQFCKDNGISGITDELIVGKKYIINQENIINKQVVEYFKTNKINPATA